MSHPVNRLLNKLRGMQGAPISPFAELIDGMTRQDELPRVTASIKIPRPDEYSPIKPPPEWKVAQLGLAMEEARREPLWRNDKLQVVMAMVAILTLLGLLGYALTRAQAPKVTHGVSQNSMDRSRHRDERVWEGKFEHPPGRVFVSMLVHSGNGPGPDTNPTEERMNG